MASFLNLKKSNCKNCYKCIRHCPVKSIKFSGNQAHIVNNECILCGQCFVICPQNAKEILDETEKVKTFIQYGNPVIASLAPSFIANYNNIGIDEMSNALKKLGFFKVEETAMGATIVKNEYERMLKEEKKDVLITSCCHSVNLLIQKYFPSVLPYLADLVSPMQAHCISIKERYPNAKTVFIGPCVAKKDEADHYKGVVDAVLTFEELTNWLDDENIQLSPKEDKDEYTKARLFPTTGGIIKTLSEQLPEYTYLSIDGTENCISALNDIAKGNIHKCFIEMSACTGSCIGGPVMEKYHYSPVQNYKSIINYAGNKDFQVEETKTANLKKNMEYIPCDLPYPSQIEINHILRQMGKMKPSDELNCGSCGYNTCRDKAIAIYQGKANISMCLPFLKEKAESFSDNIVNNTTNGIIVLNEDLEVQQINIAARKMMNIKSTSDVLGEPVVRILDPTPFMQVIQNKKNIHDKETYLAEYDKYIQQSILYDKDYHILICIIRDITDEEKQRKSKENMSRKTIDIADKVVDKQMRIVQEIASLLGETAAETKIALTKLKESIQDE